MTNQKLQPGKMQFRNLSRRQRHMYLNKEVGHSPKEIPFSYISDRQIEDSEIVTAYKVLFLKLVYGKEPLTVASLQALHALLHKIKKEWEGLTQENVDLLDEIEI